MDLVCSATPSLKANFCKIVKLPGTELENKWSINFVQFSHSPLPLLTKKKLMECPSAFPLWKLQMRNMSETDPKMILTWQVKLWHEALKNVLARIWHSKGAKFRDHDSVVLAVGQVRITPEKLAAVFHHPIPNFKLMHECHAIKPVVVPSFGEDKYRLEKEKAMCKAYPTSSNHPLCLLDDKKWPFRYTSAHKGHIRL